MAPAVFARDENSIIIMGGHPALDYDECRSDVVLIDTKTSVARILNTAM